MYPRRTRHNRSIRLLVEGLGVGGGGRNVGVTGSLVRASGELELVGGLEVGIAGGAVGGGVILEVEQESEHFCKETAKRQNKREINGNDCNESLTKFKRYRQQHIPVV